MDFKVEWCDFKYQQDWLLSLYRRIGTTYISKHISQVFARACLQTLKPRLRLEASTTVELVRGISRVRT